PLQVALVGDLDVVGAGLVMPVQLQRVVDVVEALEAFDGGEHQRSLMRKYSVWSSVRPARVTMRTVTPSTSGGAGGVARVPPASHTFTRLAPDTMTLVCTVMVAPGGCTTVFWVMVSVPSQSSKIQS